MKYAEQIPNDKKTMFEKQWGVKIRYLLHVCQVAQAFPLPAPTS